MGALHPMIIREMPLFGPGASSMSTTAATPPTGIIVSAWMMSVTHAAISVCRYPGAIQVDGRRFRCRTKERSEDPR